MHHMTAPTLPIFSPLYFLCFNYKHLGLGLLVCGRSVSQKVFKTRFAFNVRGGQPSTRRNKQKQQQKRKIIKIILTDKSHYPHCPSKIWTIHISRNTSFALTSSPNPKQYSTEAGGGPYSLGALR